MKIHKLACNCATCLADLEQIVAKTSKESRIGGLLQAKDKIQREWLTSLDNPCDIDSYNAGLKQAIKIINKLIKSI